MSEESALKSNIPILVDSSPPLSEFTQRNRVMKDENQLRRPLETLYKEAINSESNYNKRSEQVLRRSNSDLTEINSKHVTTRKNYKELDWDFKVFHDNIDSQDNRDGKNIDNKRAVEAFKQSAVKKNRQATPINKSLLAPSKRENLKRIDFENHLRFDKDEESIGNTPSRVTIRKKKNRNLDLENYLLFDKDEESTGNTPSRVTERRKKKRNLVFEEQQPVQLIKDNESSINKRVLPAQQSNKAAQQSNKADQQSRIAVSRPATPLPNSLFPSRKLRNEKRTHKVRHNQEVIGISPAVNDDKVGDEKHRRRLDFDSDSQPNDLRLRSYETKYNEDYGSDMFDYLMMREKIPQMPCMLKEVRAAVINHLLLFDDLIENPATVQTAAWYFDTLASVSEIMTDDLDMIAAACYWIASKVYGNCILIASDLVECDKAWRLVATEIDVLKALKFKIQPIVAQDFISYLSWVCDSSNFGKYETAATFIYTAGLVISSFISKNYPSVLAAAAMCTALNLLNEVELLTKLGNNDVYKKAVKKAGNFMDLCRRLRKALRYMTAPNCKYQALLEKMNGHALTETILTSLKDRYYEMYLPLIRA